MAEDLDAGLVNDYEKNDAYELEPVSGANTDGNCRHGLGAWT